MTMRRVAFLSLVTLWSLASCTAILDTSTLKASDGGVTNPDQGGGNADAQGDGGIPIQPGLVIGSGDGLTTSEAGQTAEFTVRLKTQPADSVAVSISSTKDTEGTVSPTQLNFNRGNWDIPIKVTITGQDDGDLADGNQPYSIILTTTSSDPDYSDLEQEINVTNIDNDTPDIVPDQTQISVNEEGATSASFNVSLTKKPTTNVTVTINVPEQFQGDITLSTATLMFTPDDFSAGQEVTVTAVDDTRDDGRGNSEVFDISLSGTSRQGDPYHNLTGTLPVQTTVVDNDRVAVIVNPTELTIAEGAEGEFSVRLGSEPAQEVTVDLSFPAANGRDVSPASLTFGPGDYGAKTVTVTVDDDDIDNDGRQFVVVTEEVQTSDPQYSGANGADVTVKITDNDGAAIVLSKTSGLVTKESAGTDTFTVQLATQPSSDVELKVEVTQGADEIRVSTDTINFNASNPWNVAQTVTVTGEDDMIADGDQPFTITVSVNDTSDQNYQAASNVTVTGSNTDQGDTAGIVLVPSATPLTTAEDGTEATFTVELTSQPTSNVVLNVSSGNTDEVVVLDGPGGAAQAPLVVTFLPGQWQTPKTVVLKGVSDSVADGHQTVTITVSVVDGSSAPEYADVEDASVEVTNTDIP